MTVEIRQATRFTRVALGAVPPIRGCCIMAGNHGAASERARPANQKGASHDDERIVAASTERYWRHRS